MTFSMKTHTGKIKWLRSLSRRYFEDGVVIGEMFFYCYETGIVRRVLVNKQGELKLYNREVNVATKNYLRVSIPGTNYYLYQHIIAAVGLGLYDNIADKDLKGLIINHKNGDGFNNRPQNIEVVTHSLNTRHGWAIKALKQRGLWDGKLAMSAQAADYMMENKIIGKYSIEQMLEAGLLELIA